MRLLITIFLLSLTLAQGDFTDISISDLTPKQGITINSQTSPDLVGFRVSKAGDFNADGYEDVIISSHGARSTAGTVYVLFGTKNGLSDLALPSGFTPKQGVVIYGVDPGDQLGYSASYLGDVNGDKIDDIIIGTYQSFGGQGIAYVIYGSKTLPAVIDLAQGLDQNQGFKITTNNPLDYLAINVKWAGDINNDKINDIILGAYSFSNSRGAAYLIFGKQGTRNDINIVSGLISSSDGFAIFGALDNDSLGVSVSGAGDFDGDGIGDVIIGATEAEGNFGGVYVIYGKDGSMMNSFQTINLAGGLHPSKGCKVKGSAGSTRFASDIASAVYFNGDGRPDFIIGASNENILEGAAYVIFGQAERNLFSTADTDLSSGPLDPARGVKIKGAISPSSFGFSVNGAGDINRDNIDDVIVGALSENGTGAAYVIFGIKGVSSEIALSAGLSPEKGFRITGRSAGALFGGSVSGAGDVNADGENDVVVGSFGENSSAGATYIIFTAGKG